MLNYNLSTIITMFSESKVTEIYFMADDFCKEFALQQKKYMVEDQSHKHRNKPNRMSDSEIMVILILFHSGGFRCFKHYYKEYVCKHLSHLFPSPVSYKPLCGIGKGSTAPFDQLYQESSVGDLHRYQFCRFNSLACLSQPTDTDS